MNKTKKNNRKRTTNTNRTGTNSTGTNSTGTNSTGTNSRFTNTKDNSSSRMLQLEKKGKTLKKQSMKENKLKSLNKKEIIKIINKNIKCNFLNVDMNFKKVGEGLSNYVVSGCLDNNEICEKKAAFRITVISTYYPNNDQHPANFEILLYHKLNKLVDKDITPHIIYLYKSMVCNFDDVLGNYNENITQKIKSKINKGELDNKINILILEFAQLGTILSFVKKKLSKLIDFKVLFFQIISTLVIIQYHIPNFIHGDIHCQNIIIQRELYGYLLNELKGGKPKYIKYKIFEKDFYIPCTGFTAKIFDFDFSNCNELKNSKMEENYVKKTGLTGDYNPVFDYHLFLNSLMYDKDKYNNPNIPTEVFNFFNEQIPEQYQGWENNYLSFARLTNYQQTQDVNKSNLVPDSIRTPSDVLLNHPFFDIFRKKPKKIIIIKEYNSKVPHEKKLYSRKDMFK